MAKQNAYIMQAAEAEIIRRIKRGELILPDMVKEEMLANLDVWSKMMTIAVNRGLGIGKKRFERDVQPILDQLLDEFSKNRDDAYSDTTHAVSVVDRMYKEIME